MTPATGITSEELQARRASLLGHVRGLGLAVFVPEFEVARVRDESGFERVESYAEYPGLEHPMRLLSAVLSDMCVGGVGADENGYPGILGYQGPALSEVCGRPVMPLAPCIESMMVRKSDAEVELIRESARWCEHAHRARGDARDARGARFVLRRPAVVLRRRHRRLPRPDRPQERVGARGRA